MDMQACGIPDKQIIEPWMTLFYKDDHDVHYYDSIAKVNNVKNTSFKVTN